MAWGRTPDRVRTAAERRLADVARQWRPVDAPPSVSPGSGVDAGPWRWAEPDPDEAPRRRARVGSWGRPALRGLAMLVAIVVALAAYGAWSGRPRAVAQAPEMLATGSPVTGLSGTGVPSVAPMAASPSTSAAASPSASSAPALPDVVVHVAGLVARPGLVHLPAGSRVADAVEAAGGVTRRRAADSVNLARVLVDGEQVVVTDAAPAAAAAAGATPAAPVPIDLNTATVESLDGLPGVGPVIAARIIAWRTANGAFRSVDELGEVSGIGDAILAQVRALVRV